MKWRANTNLDIHLIGLSKEELQREALEHNMKANGMILNLKHCAYLANTNRFSISSVSIIIDFI